MAYVQSQNPSQRGLTIGLVLTLHALAAYALITGLAAHIMTVVEQRLPGYEVKVEVPVDPLPAPPDARDDSAKDPTIITTPLDFGLGPVNLPKVDELLPPDSLPDLTPFKPEPPRFAPKAALPRENPGLWVTQEDYPTRAIREGRAGVSAFRLDIDANGRVSACTITSSSGHADLDQAACKYLRQRARFDPARNGNGEDVTGTYSNAIRWVVPD